MRFLLAVLLSFLLLHTQCLALHASDEESGPGIPVNVVGTYGGVLIPFDVTGGTEGSGDFLDDDNVEPGETPIADFTGANSLVIFALTVPLTGTADGVVLVFAQGRLFTGTINGFGDPDSGRIVAVIDSQFDYTLGVAVTNVVDGDVVTTIEEQDVTATAVGSFVARVVPTLIAGANNVAFIGSDATTANAVVAQSIARLTGIANLDINQGLVETTTFEPIINLSLQFVIDGIKQSDEIIDVGTFATTVTTGV